MDSIVRVWKRFLRKIAMVKTHFLASGGFEALDTRMAALACNKGEGWGEKNILGYS